MSKYSHWIVAKPQETDAALSPMLGHLLAVRGIMDWREAERFIEEPIFEHDPRLLPNIDAAIDRIKYAVHHDENIVVYGDFDCLDSEEYVWSSPGLVKIKDIKPGDLVITEQGYSIVNAVHEKCDDSWVELQTGAFRNDPLIMSINHRCLIVTNEVAKKTGFVSYTKRNGLVTNKGIMNKGTSFTLSEARASEVREGDFLAFPVLKDRISVDLDPDVAWLYGIYLAEGYTQNRDRVVCFCFNKNEEHTLVKRVESILLKHFGLESKKWYEGNSMKIRVISPDLAKLLMRMFNKGSFNKSIPAECLFWPQNLQCELLDGYFEGDGCKNTGLAPTVSQKLGYGLFALAIQAERFTSITYCEGRGLDERNNAPSWTTRKKKRANINGFYVDIEGTKYFLSKVLSNTECRGDKTFIDIETSTHTFLTKMGLTHNCDGLMSSAVLYNTLQSLGTTPTVIVPQRKEGHGIANFRLKELADRGTNLIITVDNGVGAVQEVAEAKALGMDVIVIDHHVPGDELPDCLIVNPHLPGSQYPFTGLAGVGVTYKVAKLLLGGPIDLDLVALGTVADVVPLRDENRGLVLRGLAQMKKGQKIGLTNLLYACDIEPTKIDAMSISFYVAPRINAANRLADPTVAFELLISDDYDWTNEVCSHLGNLNEERKRLVDSCLPECLAQVSDDDKLAIVRGAWKPGLSGLIAPRLVERFGVPAIVATNDEYGRIVASCRSGKHELGAAPSGYSGVNIIELLEKAEGSGAHFHKFGGHERAAGFTVRPKHWDDAVAALREASKDIEPSPSTLWIDAHIPLTRVTLNSLREIERIAPFGEEFPEPLFLSENVTITKQKPIGADGKHLSFRLHKGDFSVRGVMFAHTPELETVDQPIDVVYQMQKNTFFGYPSAEVLVRDWKFSSDV